MSDSEHAAAAEAADIYSVVDRDDAFEYWSEQVRRLSTAKYRTLSDHFRRDTVDAVRAPR